MGEDVDFFEAAPIPGLAAELRELANPPRDADALAALIARHCGHEIEFGLDKFEKGYAEQRAKTAKRLLKMKAQAETLLGDGGGEVFAFSVTLDDLFPEHVSSSERQRLKKEILAAVMTLSSLPKLSKPNGRVVADRMAKNVIRAIREYCETHEEPFSGGPKRRADQSWADNAVEQGSPATRLIGEVLTLLGLRLDVGALNERIRSVREESRWF